MLRNPGGIYAEWGLYKILEYMGLHEIFPPGSGKNRAKLRKEIEEYHTAYAIDFDDTDIDTFIARRPDGLAFQWQGREIVCILGIIVHESHGHKWRLGREEGAGEKLQV